MTSVHTKNSFAVLAALTVIAPLAGCSLGSTAGDSAGAGVEAPAAPAAPVVQADYTDGEYTESGSYQSPNGTESVTVTITLAANTVTAVTVVGDGQSSNSQIYQEMFANGIGNEVVGKNIDELAVDKVAGSSLTSGGFNDALATIKADALK
jgi:uncharacterized protein with FMN-binding domain